jgi:hypothetical protein
MGAAMSPAARRFRYDVFLGYSHRDKDWVRQWLVPRLRNAALTVCIDHESFEPGAPSITEMERAVLQSRKTVLVLTPAYLLSEWAEFENILVQTLDPANRQRRLIPMLYTPCELPLRLRALTFVDFTRVDEHAAQVNRLIEAIRRRLATSRRRQTVTAVSLPFEVPTGALSPDSPLYIERDHDDLMRQQVIRQGSTTIIEGARQMGKTSLVARALARARSQQYTAVDFNFQTLDDQHFDSLQTLLHYLALAVHERLQLPEDRQRIWQGPLGAKDKLTSFLHSAVLQGARSPVVMVMDEVDRVFGRPYQDDFFALLRSWHDRRAFDPHWTKLNLVLSYSTDPRQAITDLNQSPFNVGIKVQLGDFSFDEVWELNRRYECPLTRKNQLTLLMDLISGNPYLAQQALYALASRTHTLPDLLRTDNADAGPFADHLQHYQRLLVTEPTLRQGMQDVLRHGGCPDYGVFLRLRALGLITGVDHQRAMPRCRLYAEYFQRTLS